MPKRPPNKVQRSQRDAARIWRRVYKRYPNAFELPRDEWMIQEWQSHAARWLRMGQPPVQVEHRLIGRLHARTLLLIECKAQCVKRALLEVRVPCDGRGEACLGCSDCNGRGKVK